MKTWREKTLLKLFNHIALQTHVYCPLGMSGKRYHVSDEAGYPSVFEHTSKVIIYLDNLEKSGILGKKLMDTYTN